MGGTSCEALGLSEVGGTAEHRSAFAIETFHPFALPTPSLSLNSKRRGVGGRVDVFRVDDAAGVLHRRLRRPRVLHLAAAEDRRHCQPAHRARNDAVRRAAPAGSACWLPLAAGLLETETHPRRARRAASQIMKPFVSHPSMHNAWLIEGQMRRPCVSRMCFHVQLIEGRMMVVAPKDMATCDRVGSLRERFLCTYMTPHFWLAEMKEACAAHDARRAATPGGRSENCAGRTRVSSSSSSNSSRCSRRISSRSSRSGSRSGRVSVEAVCVGDRLP